MKKKMIYTALMAILAVSVLGGCGKKEKKETASTSAGNISSEKKGEDTSLEDLKAKGKLVIGFDNALPPMGFLNEDQENVGFDLDLAKEVAKRMGVEPVLKPISWKAKDQEMKAKNIDCLWNGFSVSEERKQTYDLTETYMLNRQVVVTLIDSDANALSDLKGKKVILQNGSTADLALNNNEEFKSSLGDVVYVEDNIQAMLDLKIGSSDAVVMDEVVASYYMGLDANKGKYKVLEDSLSDEEYAVAFRKGDDALCQEVNKILKEMAADGTLEKISTQWFGKDLTTIK